MKLRSGLQVHTDVKALFVEILAKQTSAKMGWVLNFQAHEAISLQPSTASLFSLHKVLGQGLTREELVCK